MKLCVIGCGYVGLVTGTCLAEMGNEVVGVDNDRERIETLQAGHLPIHEPGLSELLERNMEGERLSFTTEAAEGVRHGRIIFICVGTPPASDGSTDLSAVMEASRAIGREMDSYKIVVLKSTVPVGTSQRVRAQIEALTEEEFDVVNNPEFLKEGAAVDDFFRPDRVVVGSDSERALRALKALYSPFLRTGKPFMTMSNASAEMVKHASNAMLATRISFINELAALCEEAGADVEDVRLGLAADGRIGPQFLFPGLGFGGSCLPKDIRSLAHVGRLHGRRMYITEAAETTNQKARERFLERIAGHFGDDLNGRALAVWGLAFKPRTDDVRESPALWLIEQILQRWPQVQVRAHDPVANETAAARLPDSVDFFDEQYEPLAGAQALVVCTDWNEFRSPDFERIKELLDEPVIFDGRNLHEPSVLKEAGFTYYSVGRQPVRGQ